MLDSIEIIDESILTILNSYPDPIKFLEEAIKLMDKLLLFHREILGIYTKNEINNNWKSLISACNKSIDFLIQSSIESEYCKFD